MMDTTIEYEQIDLEEVIHIANLKDIENKLPNIESDEEALILLMQDYTGESLHHVEADIDHQIDPSYQ